MSDQDKAVYKGVLVTRRNNAIRERAETELSIKFINGLVDRNLATDQEKEQRETLKKDLRRLDWVDELIEAELKALEE